MSIAETPEKMTAEERSAKNAARINAQTALSQEIGPLPAVKDPDRRARCKFDLKLFALTYFKSACHMGFAPYQIEMVSAFESVTLNGGRKARAVRRGGLKSTLVRIATAWAVLNGHRKFPVPVGATDDKANEWSDNFFKMLATSKDLLEDFPELTPLLMKWRNPKKQLRLNGEILQVMRKDDRGCILFPNIAGTELCEARVAPYSILATDVSGLSFVDDTGKTVRPDMLIFDDVQTPQSAKSFPQTDTRENVIDTTFMGLAGLGETMAAIMVCTVREVDDLTMRFCDRDRHPDWDGQRFPVLITEPGSDDAKLDKEIKAHWAAYGRLLREGKTPHDGFTKATGYYKQHRQIMDTGGKVAWDQDKEAGYESALQWCMTVSILQPEYFRRELQQNGAVPVDGIVQLSAESIIQRLSRIPKGTVPAQASYLTAFVDSSDQVLWWMVCGWAKDFTGWIVDYGTWPDQGRQQFYKSHLQATISQQLPGVSWEQAFVHAHNELEKQLFRDWLTEDRLPRQIDLMLKDWHDPDHNPRIKTQISASPYKAQMRASEGHAPEPGRKPVHLYGSDTIDRHTFSHWVERRSKTPFYVQFDTNRWKRFISQRLMTVAGAPTSLLLPGDSDRALSLLAEHFTAERAEVKDETVLYKCPVGRDNDWFDCIVGNAVAASMLGCAIPGEVVARPVKKMLSAAEIQARRAASRGRA